MVILYREEIEQDLAEHGIRSSSDAQRLSDWMRNLKESYFPDESVVIEGCGHHDLAEDDRKVFFARLLKKEEVWLQVPEWEFLWFRSRCYRAIRTPIQKTLLQVQLGTTPGGAFNFHGEVLSSHGVYVCGEAVSESPE
jgi:hypothetical protein